MKKEFFAIALFLGISNIAVAQWANQGGMGGGGSNGGGSLMRRPMPDVQRQLAPFIKGEQPLSATWDPVIADPANQPDGGTIYCMAADTDNLYIAGDFYQFDTVAVTNIAHYNRKTKVWSALPGGPNNVIRTIAVHNGKLYAGGDFQSIGSNITVNYIAVWNGTSWEGIGGGMDYGVQALAFIGDTLYAGGYFLHAGNNTAYHLARWDGTSWSEAGGGTSYPVYSLLATHDSLFVGGEFAYVGSEGNVGQLANGIALLRDGNWTSFGSGLSQVVTMALFEGKLWCGTTSYSTADNSFVFYGLSSWDGSTWNTYGHDSVIGTHAHGDIYHLQPFGDTLIALGEFNQIAGVSTIAIGMYHGGSWSAVPGGLFGFAITAIPFDGKLYVGGLFTRAGTVSTSGIATLSASGIWAAVGSGLGVSSGWESDLVRAIATNDRYVFLGGNFTTIAGMVCNHVAAWDKVAHQWSTLGLGVDGDVYSLAVAGNNLIVGGYFHRAGMVTAERIAQCDITAKIWSAMGRGSDRSVSSIVSDGTNVYAATYYDLEQDWTDHIGKWDGTNWSLYSGGMTGGYVNALALQGSTLYAGGSFNVADYITVNGIAQLQSGSWGALNSGLNSVVNALAVSGDSLYVGGGFTKVDGMPDSALAVWNGNTWNPMGVGFNGTVEALVSDGKGGVTAGGGFTAVKGVTRDHLVHWSGYGYGTVGSGVNNDVVALATDPTALYAGGWFTGAAGSSVTTLHFGALDGAGAGVTALASSDGSWSVYPNPSPASSTISLDLAKSADVRIELFNAIGSRISVLANGLYPTGQQDFSLDVRALPSGIYFLRLMSDGVVTTKNFVVERE